MVKKNFENLDGFRFLAAVSVILGHCAYFLRFSIDGFFYKIKNIPFLNRLGKFTYGMYAYHLSVVILLSKFFTGFFAEKTNSYSVYLLHLFAAGLFSLLISMASYYAVESPLLKLKNKFA
ncbi:MAG: hypothetical protein K1X72_09410 [Pyrinomonadaceae bacterium]|nr:hypothetical protein [Pyrinomonadaceae bacterium]